MYIEFAGKLKSEMEGILSKSLMAQKKIALNNLLREAAKLTNNFESELDKALIESANLGTEANKYIMGKYSSKLGKKGFNVNKILSKIPDEAVRLTASRIWSDGLKLSDRIWRLDKATKGQIERLVMEAISTGRSASDPVLTKALASMFNPNYTGTITELHGRKVWYEATRILRTENRIAFMEANRLSTKANPGVQMMDWRRGGYEDCDICDRLAEEGPYKPDELPYHSHPSCMCYTVPIAESVESFTDRYLEFKENPSSQPDLMEWAKIYLRKAS